MSNPTRTAVGGAAAVKVALLASRDLRPNERLVLVAIAAHTNYETGDAFPSVATIAEYAGVSPRTVHRVLARLVQLGRLAVRKVAGIASNVYRLVVDAVTPTAPGSAIPAGGSANPGPGSATDSGNVADKALEDQSKLKGRAAALRRFLPGAKSNNPPQQRQPYGYPQRQGAALPPAPGGDRCQRPGHVGQLAGRCIPCRSEALAGGR
ncbi:helix-turn-helix domain-containing protein [Micromonospora purpureochromogenes]|uniref:helix-turn-helix domain-containing protein n=1 Tax=Micromonospora purpureochromogenes TaxID=47872 RepID=UPI0033C8D227